MINTCRVQLLRNVRASLINRAAVGMLILMGGVGMGIGMRSIPMRLWGLGYVKILNRCEIQWKRVEYGVNVIELDRLLVLVSVDKY